VIYTRSPVHGAAIMDKLQAGDIVTGLCQTKCSRWPGRGSFMP
jgi:hypothetical protein